MRVLGIFLVALLFGVLSISGAPAQMLPGLDGDQSAEESTQPTALELQTLVELLEDERVRTWLREQALAATADIADDEASNMTFSEWVGQHFSLIEEKVTLLANASMAAPAAFDRAVAIIRIELDQRPYTILVSVLIFLGVGYILEYAFYKSFTRNKAVRAYFLDRKRTAIDQLKMNLYRMVIDWLTVLVFALGSIGAFLLTPRTLVFEILVVTYLSVFVLVRFASAMGRFVLAPWEIASHLRLVRISTAKARFIHRWMQLLTFLGSFGLLTAEALDELGLAPEVAFLTRQLTVAVLIVFLLMGKVLYRRLSRQEGDLGGMVRMWLSIVLLPIAWVAWVHRASRPPLPP